MNKDFYKEGLKTGTDKITHHGYHRFYDSVIDRNSKKMLEIGIEQSKSLNMWFNYLPNCYIYGVDINLEMKGDNYTIFKYDQSNANNLHELVEKIGNKELDFILDDGSHIPEHQILSFDILFDLVKDGGIYIIEDIETSYWKNGDLYGYDTRYGCNNEMNLINFFSKVLHLINKEFMNENDILQITESFGISNKNIDAISTITFGQNCIIIKKKEEYEYLYNNREYRFKDHIN
jgi:hypothetical protein